MTCLDEFGSLGAVFVTIFVFVIFSFQGAHSELVVSPVGSSRVNSTAGSNVTLAVSFSGAPDPAVTWVMGDLPVVTWTINSTTPPDIAENIRKVVKLEPNGSLTFVSVTIGYTNNYTIEMTKPGLSKAVTSFTLKVFESPSGNPMCLVQAVDNSSLQYYCEWPGGTPQAQLSFPALSNFSNGAGNFSLTVTASDNLNGKTVMCIADHPAEQKKCNITASSPVDFLPAVRSTVDAEDKIIVTINCLSEASPKAVVSWTEGREALTTGTVYQISNDTTQLQIRDYNVSNFPLHNYTCTCYNPLGSQGREIQLQGPTISDSNLLPNKDRTSVTLTWETPFTSVVTGFDVQMIGPDLLNKSHNGTQTRGSSNTYRTIQQKSGTARSADISPLNPHLTYQFRIIPKARMTEGAPSVVHRFGPIRNKLSGPAIAGIAAGIPCSLLFLLLLLGSLIYLYVYCNKKKSRQTRYPVTRAVEKAITTQSNTSPNQKSAPGYNGFQQTPSEKSVDLPMFVPPPPVRVATTV